MAIIFAYRAVTPIFIARFAQYLSFGCRHTENLKAILARLCIFSRDELVNNSTNGILLLLSQAK